MPPSTTRASPAKDRAGPGSAYQTAASAQKDGGRPGKASGRRISLLSLALAASATATLLLAAWCLGGGRGGGHTAPLLPTFRSINGTLHPRAGPVSPAEVAASAAEAAAMFGTAFDAYLTHAFPHDDLKPLSCSGGDSQGGVALTLIDSLSTALLLGDAPRLGAGLAAAASTVGGRRVLDFDVPARVHVFELTIRALGGLLSVHAALTRPGNGALLASLPPGTPPPAVLLAAAVDLGRRLLPAYDTPTGLPLSWVNLRSGPIPESTRLTCAACAGTAFMEMAALTAATGDGRFAAAARRAAFALAARADPATGLVGNTLSVDTGAWARTDAGVGAGIDSYYEYLLKSYLLTGDEAWLGAWAAAHAALMRWCNAPTLPPGRGGDRSVPPPWRVDVDMGTGALAKPWVSSLAAFFPGLQALAGQTRAAAAGHAAWAATWARFSGLPEAVDALTGTVRHPTMGGYPLRPELAESTYALAAAAAAGAPPPGAPRLPVLLRVGRMVQADLVERATAPCGFAALGDVSVPGRASQVDAMESFVLAETVKYLHLLWTVPDGAGGLLDAAVLTTEGHPLFPLNVTGGDGGGGPTPAAWLAGWLAEAGASGTVTPNSSTTTATLAACAPLCEHVTSPGDAAASLSSVLPFLAPAASDIAALRTRRCRACLVTEAAMVAVRDEQERDEHEQERDHHHHHHHQLNHPRARPRRHAVCLLAADEGAAAGGGGLTCTGLSPLLSAGVTSSSSLPPNAIIIQLSEVVEEKEEGRGGGGGGTCAAVADDGPWRYALHLTSAGGGIDVRLAGLAATFGPALREAEACGEVGYGGGGDARPCSLSDARPCSLSGPLVLGAPADGCAPPLAPFPPAAVLVLVRGGGCSFEAKAAAAAAGGAAALVVLNGQDAHVAMGPASEEGGPEEAATSIPALALPASQARALRDALATATAAAAPLTATLTALPLEGEAVWPGAPSEADAAAGGGGDPPLPPLSPPAPSNPHRLDLLLLPGTHAWLAAAAASAADAWEPRAALAALVKRLAGSRDLAAALEGAPELAGARGRA